VAIALISAVTVGVGERVGEAEGVKLLVEEVPTDKTALVGVLVTLGAGMCELVLESDLVDVLESDFVDVLESDLVDVLESDFVDVEDLEAEGGGAMQSGATRSVGESHT